MEQEKREVNRRLFHKLLAYTEQGKYDDDYLQALIEFWQFSPENEVEGDILYAEYALYHKSYAVAYEYVQKAYRLRKVNWRMWQIMRDSCYALGKVQEALLFAGFAEKFYRDPIKLDIPKDGLQDALDILSLGMGRGNFAPVAQARMYLTENGIESHEAIFAGEFLPYEGGEETYSIFSGAYVEQEMMNYKGRLLSFIKDVPELARISGADFVYDLIRVTEAGNQCRITVNDEKVLVGLVGAEEQQRIDFHSRNEDTVDYLGKWATSFFCLQEDTDITSDKPILCTRKIVMQHKPERCKVVLNILLDGLCWRAVQEENYELVPNILNFFQKGVIFNNHYSVSEYTFPSLATIETGLYPWHSQIFNELASHSLNRIIRVFQSECGI